MQCWLGRGPQYQFRTEGCFWPRTAIYHTSRGPRLGQGPLEHPPGRRRPAGYNPGMPRDRIFLTEVQWAAVVAHLQACLPEEGCGLLGGHADRVALALPIENVEHSPVHYHMEHRALVAAFGRLEKLGLDLLAAFHSHPGGPFGVSDSDVREWQYPEAALVVCVPREKGWAARALIVDEGGVIEIPLLIGEE